MTPLHPIERVAVIPNEEIPIEQALLKDLEELDIQLEQYGMTDELSKNLRSWVGYFIHILKLGNPLEAFLERIVQQVHQFLRNPFGALWPFDEQVFLGNDGQCYSRKALAVYLSCCEPKYLQRSPFAPHDPTPFFLVGPHKTAYALQKWLISHGIELQSSEVDRLYSQLENQGKLVAIPMGRPVSSERRARLIARQEQRENETRFNQTAERINAFFQRILEQHANQVVENEALQNRISEFAEQNRQIADRIRGLAFEGPQNNIEQELLQFQEALQAAMNHQDAGNEEMLQIRREFAGRFAGYLNRFEQAQAQLHYLQTEVVDFFVGNLETQIQRIDAHIGEQNEQLHHLGTGIQSVKYQQLAMDIALNELDRAIKRKQQSFWKMVGMNLLQLGLYWGGSWALNSLVKGMSVFSSPKYGPMLSYTKQL